MGTLDSRIALALMAKAQLVFGQANVVLAFPIGGSSYTASQLNFFPEAPSAEAARLALAGLSDFSAFVNAIPDGRVWQTLADRPALPQVYRRVLEQAELAALPEDPRDLDQLRAARALILAPGPDGSLVDTPAYARYKECRDAWLLASQEYNAAKASGELGDAAARQAWEAAEPDLRAARDTALAAWQLEGRRAEIDDALAKITQLNQKTPATTWGEWDLRSRPGAGTMADLSGAQFWPTYISPANVCESGWQTMRLGPGEVQALQGSAPEQLKARLGNAGGTLEVEDLEFEYTSAKLKRPWFDAALFPARFWRPRAPAQIALSSGAEPYTGECPLYASGVVFFRRIRATVKGETAAVNQRLGDLGEQLDMGILQLKRQRVQVMSAAAPPALTAAAPAAPVAAAGPSLRPEVASLRSTGLARAALRAPLSGSIQAERFETDEPRVQLDPRQRFAMQAILNKRLVIRQPLPRPRPIPPPPPPQPGNSVLETAPDDIFILALICTVVPPSPSPDPALAWPK